MNNYNDAIQILSEWFGHDTLLSLATSDGERPYVRIVNSYYEGGAFYVITRARSNKMQQIANHPEVAICGEWFTAHGVGENIGHVREERNSAIMAKLRDAFAAWYDNGHVNEDNPNTCILRIRLTDGVLMSRGTKYEIDFVNQTA